MWQIRLIRSNILCRSSRYEFEGLEPSKSYPFQLRNRGLARLDTGLIGYLAEITGIDMRVLYMQTCNSSASATPVLVQATALVSGTLAYVERCGDGAKEAYLEPVINFVPLFAFG